MNNAGSTTSIAVKYISSLPSSFNAGLPGYSGNENILSFSAITNVSNISLFDVTKSEYVKREEPNASTARLTH